MKTIILTLLLAFTTISYANPNSSDLQTLEEIQVIKVPMTSDEYRKLPAYIKEGITTAAYELSSIWGDTILEGDYYAEEKIQVDLVEKLYISNAHMGYRITYSAKAWDTSTCQFDINQLESLASCDEGRIIESGFLSLDFTELSRDPQAFAKFSKNSN
jgi:hypothetical protein